LAGQVPDIRIRLLMFVTAQIMRTTLKEKIRLIFLSCRGIITGDIVVL